MKLVMLITPSIYTRSGLAFTKLCIRDCFAKGEYPFSPNLMYQSVYENPKEYNPGITAGIEWSSRADYAVVYTDDQGVTESMKTLIQSSEKNTKEVVYRRLKAIR